MVYTGHKLPIFFVMRGTERGAVRDELASYPEGHFYTTQAHAWMDSRVWREYLRFVMPEIEGPSVLVVDNLDCHVSDAAHEIVSGELKRAHPAVAPNSTS